MTTSRHLMLDTETFSLAPNAFVWEVGLMPFTLDISDGGMVVGMGESVRLVLNPFRHHADRIDASTVKWTQETRKDDAAALAMCGVAFGEYAASQKYVVRKIVEHSGVEWMETVGELVELISDVLDAQVPVGGVNGNYYVWARNAAFDFPILDNLFTGAGLKLPWHRRQQCCVYTAQNMALMQGFIPEVAPKTKHQAAEDCEKQVQEVIASLAYLHNLGVAYV